MSLPTLLDVAKIDAGAPYNLINEAVTSLRPELKLIPADTMEGISMPLSVIVGLPTVAFRHHNEGTPSSKPRFEQRIFQCGIIDQQIPVDKAVADKSKNYGRFLEAQTMPHLEAALDWVCKQFWYGVSNDAKGFVGLIAQSNSAATHVVDAGASSAKSSVWFIETGMEKLEWLWGNGKTIAIGDWREESLYDSNNNAYPGLVNWLSGRPGLRLANKNKAVRIKNVGAHTDTTHDLDDALMRQAFELCTTIGMTPNLIVMTARSRTQLAANRTAYDPSGKPVPLPRDWEGIPIEVSTNLSNDETI